MVITVTHGRMVYPTDSLTFPGGEQHVSIPGLPEHIEGRVTVTARLQSSGALVHLALTKEILDRVHRGTRQLVIPYFPYARQDRVTEHHVAFSLKPIAGIVNSLGFDEVVICDPHSDVTPALLSNIRIVTQGELIETHKDLREVLWGEVIIIAPDAGAEKKAIGISAQYEKPLVTASKVRDVATGQITQTRLHGNVAGMHALIVDDICDGGRTFIELAKVIRAGGASSVSLYVTHGIFSKGLADFAGLIDGIYTTDSFLSRDVLAPHQSPTPLYVSSINLAM